MHSSTGSPQAACGRQPCARAARALPARRVRCPGWTGKPPGNRALPRFVLTRAPASHRSRCRVPRLLWTRATSTATCTGLPRCHPRWPRLRRGLARAACRWLARRASAQARCGYVLLAAVFAPCFRSHPCACPGPRTVCHAARSHAAPSGYRASGCILEAAIRGASFCSLSWKASPHSHGLRRGAGGVSRGNGGGHELAGRGVRAAEPPPEAAAVTGACLACTSLWLVGAALKLSAHAAPRRMRRAQRAPTCPRSRSRRARARCHPACGSCRCSSATRTRASRLWRRTLPPCRWRTPRRLHRTAL
jgi:hypothetical protein